MGQEQKGRKNSLLAPSLEPVKHLSARLQRKLLKREQRQRKEFRSSGKPYPLVSEESPIMDMERTLAGTPHFNMPAGRWSFTPSQRLILAIASLVIVMLLTLGLVWIAVATHPATWVVFTLLFVLVLFTAAAVIINIAFNRKR